MSVYVHAWEAEDHQKGVVNEEGGKLEEFAVTQRD